MSVLRLALIASLFGACIEPPQTGPVYPQVVGPPLGESTAMGPSDSTRSTIAKNYSPSGVPLNVGPGKPITPPAPGTYQPTEAPGVVQEQPILVVPLGGEPPPPVFTPPPPQPAPDLSDRVMADDIFEG